MGRVGPADRVQVGVPLRIGLGRRYQPAPVVLVDRHLLRQQEPRTQPRGLRAQGEHRGDAASVADPAGRDHRHRRHRVHHGGHQRQGRDGAPHVPAGLPALRDDHVRARRDRPPCFLGGADRVQDNPPGVVHALDVAAWITHEKRDNAQAGVKGLVEATVTIFGENEVAAERPRGQRRSLPDHRSDVFGPRQRQHAERAGIRDGRGEPGNRNHGGQDNRLFNPEQLAHRCAHRGHALLGSTYEVGTDPGDRRSQPWNFE